VLQGIAKRLVKLAVNGDQKAAKFVLQLFDSGKADSRDNLANLLQEFRAVNARHRAEDGDQQPVAASKAKKRT
jgi:hypothetical protein